MARAQKKLTKKELRQDPLMKSVSQAQGWMAIHGSKLAYSVLAVVVVVLALSIYSTMKSSANQDAQLVISQAKKMLAEEKKDQAESLLEQAAEKFKGTQGGAESLISLAELKLADNESEEALELFNEFTKRYGNEYLFNLSALDGSATALENLGRFDEAAVLYDKIVKSDKFGHLIPYALYSAGRCYSQIGEIDKARSRFERVMAEYEESKIKKDAERELSLLDLKG